MPTDNPAARLHEILRRGKAIKKDVPCLGAWMTLLGTQNREEVHARVGAVMGLPEAVKQAIALHLPEDDISDHWANVLNNAFTNQHMAGQWASFIGQVDDTTIHFVGMIAKLLNREVSVQVLTDDKLAELAAGIEGLRSTVLEADLDRDTTRYLLRQLRRLKKAIDEYHITGGEPILDSVEVVLGRVVCDPPFREKMKDKGQAIVEGLAILANAVTVATGMAPLMLATAVPLMELIREAIP